MTEKYDPKAIEGKWQRIWEDKKVFEAPDPSRDSLKRRKYYCLCMFPYPSGAIHMGHLRNYSIGDVISRYKRMQGFNVLQPIGWDAFGLPAENAAISRGIHPKLWTTENINQMRSELKAMGIAYDWSREITTCLPEYYRWEQLLFRKFYEQGLAYRKKAAVNWCESCKTVLANEQVQEGRCWRCDSLVGTKELSQWYLKITAYADQLLSGHELLKQGWPARVLEMQKNWIGESRGCRILFPLEKGTEPIEIFTTRADTLFGATFVTIAPGHPFAEKLCETPEAKTKLEKFRQGVASRIKPDETPDKDGFFTGSFCTHPLTGEKLPIWVGNFVVMEYGAGAVMAVPAHDERDFEFAKKFRLPIKQVILAGESENRGELSHAYTGSGALINSGKFSNMESETAKEKIAEALESKKLGLRTVQFRLRDWGISRQRYWGAPVPIIYCKACGVMLVPEKDLPVQLPMEVQFTGHGNPLEHNEGFVNVSCPKCMGPARRETDTMDTFIESSWYYARYTSPKSDREPFSKAAADQWLPVDCYIGGIEHACMHLLYSRFFHKVLRDWGYLSGDEPFMTLLSQGMVIKDGAKMSKSKGNVVAPTAIIERYGADTGRLFSLFAAPPEKDLEWNDKGVEGCHRFILRVWRLFYQFREVLKASVSDEKNVSPNDNLKSVRRKTHWTIKKMTEDIETQKYNTAISAMMELVNEIYGLLTIDERAFSSPEGVFVIREAFNALVLGLAPFAPHLCEELWEALGHKTLVADAKWPAYRADLLEQDTFLLVVQVNGKVRDRVEIAKGLSKAEIERLVIALPKLQAFVEGKTIRQFVYVPERIANLVVS